MLDSSDGSGTGRNNGVMKHLGVALNELGIGECFVPYVHSILEESCSIDELIACLHELNPCTQYEEVVRIANKLAVNGHEPHIPWSAVGDEMGDGASPGVDELTGVQDWIEDIVGDTSGDNERCGYEFDGEYDNAIDYSNSHQQYCYDDCDPATYDHGILNSGEEGLEPDYVAEEAWANSSCFEIDWVALALEVERLLEERCPNVIFSTEVIYWALYECSNDVNLAAEAIESSYILSTNCKPCRHMMTDKCLRKDCTFQHDLNGIPCRYWLLQAGCADYSVQDGGNCPFMHNIIPVETPLDLETALAIAARKQQEQFDDDFFRGTGAGAGSETSGEFNNMAPFLARTARERDEMFPELSASNQSGKTDSKGISLAKYGGWISSEYAEAVRRQPIQQQGVSVSSSSKTGSSSTKGSEKGGAGGAKVAVTVIGGGSNVVSAFAGRAAYDDDDNAYYGGKGGATAGGGRRLGSTSIETPSDWVTSGRSVATQYIALREEARSLAIARNKLLQEATQAYLGGSKDVAKSLSAKGRQMNRQMKECHIKAAQEIFRQRNAPSSVANGRLDLHGLHVAEALECLKDLLPSLKKENRSLTHATIITGSGHHTLGPQKGAARLLPAVEGWLKSSGYKYHAIRDENGYIGGAKVQL